MKIQITARHERKISDETKDFIEAEFGGLVKFYDKITSVQVILERQEHGGGGEDIVQVVVNVDNKNQLVAKSKAENLGKALDDAKDKIVRQLKKHCEIKKDHVGSPLGELAAKASATVEE